MPTTNDNQKNQSLPDDAWEKQQQQQQQQEPIAHNCEAELEKCRQLCEEYLEGWKRCKADFLNFKKEEAQRFKEAVALAKTHWALSILSVIDNWERALEHTPSDIQDSEWLFGIQQIENQLKSFLKNEGIEEIKSQNMLFNPELHEVVEQTEAEGESGTIIAVLQKGYTINGRVLRPAKVRVIK